ncbi:MAG: hypothetical protein M3524_09705 [Actinomycetota bacterium]|nr:hypothetical protein [Actinomycetota bacterium]
MTMPDAIEARVRAYLTSGTTPAALTSPINIVLLSALGAGDAPGTPITTGTTPIKAFGATGSADVGSNGAVIRYEGLPNPTVVAGFRLQDSAASPTIVVDNIPRQVGGVNTSVTVTDGILEIPANGVSVTAS